MDRRTGRAGRPQDIGGEFEKRFAKRIGGTIVPGSGNQWFAKLDVGSKSFLWSLKATAKESFRLTRGMLHETLRAIVGPGGKGGDTIPGMAVSIQGEEYVVLQLDDFLTIVREDVKLVPPTKREEQRGRAATTKFERRILSAEEDCS